VVKAWVFGFVAGCVALLAGCDTSLGGFRFSCGPDAGCPTGQTCQAGICAVPGATGGSGGASSGGTNGGVTSGTGGGTGATTSGGSSGGGSIGGSSSGGGSVGGASGCNVNGSYQLVPDLDYPQAITEDGAGNLVVVATQANGSSPELYILAPDGGVDTLLSPVPGLNGLPIGVAVDPSGNVFLLDGSAVIVEVPGEGPTSQALCSGSCFVGTAHGIAAGPNDTQYVTLDSCVMSLRNGAPVLIAGNCTSAGSANGVGASARFEGLRGVAVAPGGASLVVADGSGYCLRQIDLDAGMVSNYAGVACASQPFGTKGMPTGVAEDGAGNVFVSEVGQEADDLWEVTPSGAFFWVAGGGSSPQPSGSACAADLTQPVGVAVGPSDQLFVFNQSEPATIFEITLP
jgi:hypothetical protein